MDIYQTDYSGYTLAELDVANQNNTGTDHSSILFRPTSTSGIGQLSSSDVLEAASKHAHGAYDANCGNGDGFACRMTINLPPPYREEQRAESTFMLKLTLPYGEPSTTFSVRMCKDSGCQNYATFKGVQAQVDSTGRANELYRRIEVRIELVDTYYPYPEFAIQSTDDENNPVEKNQYVTSNCWTADGGSTSSCKPNFGDIYDPSSFSKED